MSPVPSSLNEPLPQHLAASPARWWLATRPAFLSVTLMGALLGIAACQPAEWLQGWPKAVLGLLLVLLAHAAVNVINDVADDVSGCDAANSERCFPFTGGSRFIQNGVLSREEMRRLGYGLMAVVVAGGLWLVTLAGPWLLAIGFAGVMLGWAYSVAPCKLNSRGWGELTVALCFWLVPLGMQTLLAGRPSSALLWAAWPYGWLTCALLYINQFPDRNADRLAGKHHWVARLAPQTARYGYVLWLVLAYGSVLLAVALQALPVTCLLALLTLPLSLRALSVLWRHAAQPAQLVPGIVATIVAANLNPLLMAAGLLIG
ncbi:MAG TPA: prenyltransferase [Chromobacteriaceae bacterium]|nr:prenyltransferase [Chromobacteriaceae bacterium]